MKEGLDSLASLSKINAEDMKENIDNINAAEIVDKRQHPIYHEDLDDNEVFTSQVSHEITE